MNSCFQRYYERLSKINYRMSIQSTITSGMREHNALGYS